MKKSALLVIPLALFCVLIVFLFQGLFSDPRTLDSQAKDNPVPSFELPDLMTPTRLYTPDVFRGEVTILNVWGVWCVTCAVELPFLTHLKEAEQVRFVGLYFDQDLDPDFGTKTLSRVQQEVISMLGRFGNPYQFNIFDVYRDTSLDLGVTGAPEHFLIDANGVIRMHHVGDINERVWANKIKPLYDVLLQEKNKPLAESQGGEL
ncbi:redoxin family protein [Alteromonas sp. KUL49]|uniref:redoxin family protein n=1 Tax=Alteromonas sp. KUL49 TaxID=2480798 RepID=UPI00102EF5AC|nr:redoxin family protein [Alteromonas sp. KUL49]TAP35001.1 redoxin domain-containing protein [Alteromonas sp. KUL49]GEA13447.1 thiol:disulfide interchange protein DsbE [Alteromonas sp. KUL49]